MRVIAVLLAAGQLAADMPALLQADIVWTASGGFCEPETVLPLPDNTLLVSNVCDFRKTGNGFLTLLDDNGNAIDWRVVEGLDAPLGMALRNGRLYVVDNNAVKIFRWPGLTPLQTIALDAGVANDIAVSENNTVYVTDMKRGDVIVISANLEQTVLTGNSRFPGANGVHVNKRTLYVGGKHLWRVDLRDNSITRIGPAWLTDIDGIEQEPDGTLQITPVGGPVVRLGDCVQRFGGPGVSSANHGYAADLGLALIPTGFDNTVIAIRVPRRAVGVATPAKSPGQPHVDRP